MATNSTIQALAAKSQASAAPADQPQNPPAPQQAAPDQPTPEADTDSSLSDESNAPVSLHRAFSKLQGALKDLMDGSGVKRSATIPYVHGGSTDSHIEAVGQALQQVGGVTNNVLTSSHHAGGRGFGSGDGETTAHPADKLKETIIPANSPLAKAALSAETNLINKIAGLIGDDKAVTVAKSQIKLVGKSDGAGMTLLDFVTALQGIPGPVIQTIAQRHSVAHPDGPSPRLRAPHKGRSEQQ